MGTVAYTCEPMESIRAADVFFRDIAVLVIDHFEDLLDKHGFNIPDKIREGDDYEARLYGYTYDALVDDGTRTIRARIGDEIGSLLYYKSEHRT